MRRSASFHIWLGIQSPAPACPAGTVRAVRHGACAGPPRRRQRTVQRGQCPGRAAATVREAHAPTLLPSRCSRNGAWPTPLRGPRLLSGTPWSLLRQSRPGLRRAALRRAALRRAALRRPGPARQPAGREPEPRALPAGPLQGWWGREPQGPEAPRAGECRAAWEIASGSCSAPDRPAPRWGWAAGRDSTAKDSAWAASRVRTGRQPGRRGQGTASLSLWELRQKRNQRRRRLWLLVRRVPLLREPVPLRALQLPCRAEVPHGDRPAFFGRGTCA